VGIDRAALWIERPVRKIAGSNRLNPLPHSGTISVFLLGVVIVSGLYITLFFEFGHEASYNSVASMEGHVIQRAVRALHRYSSAALVVTTVVHGWRIFAAGRYTARPRRWRWATGVAALVLVWLAGVTGYWLVWDVRAQALSDITTSLVGSTGWGASLAINQLSGISGNSGSGFLLFIWFVHIGLTALIGWFTFRHLRGSKLAWFPPRHWMLLMGGALLIVSLALPVGMLEPADPNRLLPDMPLDPFVLFMLPPLLSDARFWAITFGIVLWVGISFLPRLLRQKDPAPIVIDEDACTGCELCVIDCPYDALSMVTSGDSSLAVVDDAACVACGICLGSCAFAAIELPGAPTPVVADVAGQRVVVACDRHLAGGQTFDTGRSVVVGVRCAGMFAPSGVTAFMDEGATGVQLVGCPPGDCRFGTGNTLASERLHAERAPHPPRRWTREVVEDWVSPSELRGAIAHPGEHPEAHATRAPEGRESYVGAAVLVALSVLGIAFATRSPFRGGQNGSQVRVAVNHTAGRPLNGAEQRSIAAIDDVELTINGTPQSQLHPALSGDSSVRILDWPIDAGSASIELAVISDGVRTPVFAGEVTAKEGERVIIEVVDVPRPPGAADGEKVFTARASGCTVCHAVEPGGNGVGPSLAGVGTVAGSRVEGLNSEQYLRQSIFLPDQYIVEGWPAGQMLPIYRDRLSEAELQALVAYLLTLTEEDS
jgi:ferredoxin